MISLIIMGKPFGKQRPKFARTGKFVKTYTPVKTANYENLIKMVFARDYPDQELLQTPLNIHVTSYHQIPKSPAGGKKTKALMESKDIRPTKKPDIDNIIKIVCDALNGVAYADDRQIVGVFAQKFYSSIPRVEIEIGEVE